MFIAVDPCSTVLTMDLQEKANFTRFSRLLVDKGNEALRNTFDAIHPPSTLPDVFYSARNLFLSLRIIKNSQRKLLYPPSGNPPDSKTFDFELLFTLIRNICHFKPPVTGWNVMPVDTDRSIQANILRIKLYRDEFYIRTSSTRIDNATFESLWQEISQALVELNIPQKDLYELKTSPLEPEQERFVTRLRPKDDRESWSDGNDDEPLRKLATRNFKDKIKRKITVSQDFCNPVVDLIDITIKMVACTFTGMHCGHQLKMSEKKRQEYICWHENLTEQIKYPHALSQFFNISQLTF